jgi:ectoine hydroxylase-related dioxygenase (phytanoyl-CoA dioxygenase family)
MLTKNQIDFYHENGYLGVEGVLSAADVAALRRVTDEFVQMSAAVSEHTDVFDLEPGHTAAAPKLRRLKNPIEQHEVYNDTLRHPAILDIVEQLIGPGVRTNGNKLNMKSPEYGSPVEWHQDWVFYPHTNDDLLAVGVCMDDMMLENGCLLVIPGSHKDRIYDHHQDGRFAGAVTEEVPDADKAVPIELKAGGISIHHARTLHASATNRSAYPRRLLLFQYCALDSWPLMGIKDWGSYQASVLRGEATNRPRLAAVPVQLPWPPAERGGSIYEIQTTLRKPVFAARDR